MIQKSLLVAIAVAIVAVAVVGVIKFPITNPWVIRAKTHVFGPKAVYRPLAYYDEAWEVVLKGVKSGSSVWLRVAVDLYPALDTHPGEEMVEAVSTVIDTNPAGAIDTLVPIYGADIVCGQRGEEQTITPAVAEGRLGILKRTETTVTDKKAFETCRQVLGKSTREVK
jgi:hypothetical protein